MKNFKFLFYAFVILITLLITTVLSYSVLEPKAYDFLMKTTVTQKLPFDNKKNVYGHDNVVLVMIDDKSIEKYRWPWKRDLNNKVLKYFQEYAKPKVLVHDFAVVNLDIDNPEADKRFFDTLRSMDNIIEGCLLSTSEYKNKEQGKEYDKFFTSKYSLKNVDIKTNMPVLYESIRIAPKPYIDSVKYSDSIMMVPGFFDNGLSIALGDETCRTHEYLVNYKGNILASVAMRTFLLLKNNPKIVINNTNFEFPELNYKINLIRTPYQLIVPIKFYKRYNTGYSHKYYSAVDIMDSYDLLKAGKKPKIAPAEFKDKIVVYGANATAGNGLNDTKKTPMALETSGTDMQATSIDNLIHNDFLKVMPWWVNFLISLISMFCIYYSIKKFDLIKAVGNALSIMLVILVIVFISYYNGIVILSVTPIILCIYTILITYINRYVTEEGNKRKVTNALGKYMSEDVMKKVIQNIDNLGLGGKKAEVTVLFSDIRGFTSMSEQMSAQDVSKLLNEYFSEMEPIVTKYNGIINKFIGDAVMAVFGEPIQDESHALNAVKCGYEMLKKVEELDRKWQEEGKPVIRIGIGINTGDVFIGNIGSEKRMEYTVIGDTVNLASRLESYNKTYKTQILISSSTYNVSKEFIEVNEISDVEIRGKAQKMNIYEVINVKL